MATPGEDREGFQEMPPGAIMGDESGGKSGLDQELARKVALQTQMLEHQKEVLGYQQSLMLQQQQQPPQMAPAAPPQVPPPPQPPQQSDLMLKALQQQQMIEAEKQREAQQKLMQQQQLALMEAQRSEQQKRMMIEAQQPMPGPPLPPHMHPAGPAQPPPSQPLLSGPPQSHPGMPSQPPIPSQSILMAPMNQAQSMMPPGMMVSQGQPPNQGPPGMMFPQGQGPQGQGPQGPPPTSHHSMGPPPLSQPSGMPPMSQPGGMPPMSQPSGIPPLSPQSGMPPMSQPPGIPPLMSQVPERVFHDGSRGPDLGHMDRVPVDRGPDMEGMGRGLVDLDMRRGPIGMDRGADRGPMDRGLVGPHHDRDMRDGPRGGPPSLQQGLRGQPPPGMEPKPIQQSVPPGLREIRLPQALEKVLEFKSVRAQEMGLDAEDPEDTVNPENEQESEEAAQEGETEEDIDNMVAEGANDDDEDEMAVTKPTNRESKNKKRKKKKKAKKNRQAQQKPTNLRKQVEKKTEEDVQIEYIQEQLELDPSDPNYHTFAKIFENFKIAEAEKPKVEDKQVTKPAETVPAKAMKSDDDDDDDDDLEESAPTEDDAAKISKKKLKKLTRLSVAQLKQLVTRPDVVEMHDVTAKDPRLLVHLKATRNTVPVPRHWCYKRKYLQGKRGIEKQPFELPEFIRATGIEDMRAALQEKEEQKNLKAKMREKVRPKLGKIDIDYQKLHDAFFRFQTKPKMTIHGDLYYESKEFETRLKEKKPGNLTDDLRVALGMPVGANAERVPPPWLIAMQRYGPPPSYPNLKIPGLNAPIPEGCSFGYHAGGWGKPPVDETGKPLYGDVFGTQSGDFQETVEEEEVDKTQWGELESESESEEESEESEEEQDESGLVTPAEGLVTPSGLTSIPLGVETPDMIELRKRRIEDAMDQGGDTPALYTVLPEKKASVGGAMMGSAHIYDISGVQTGRKSGEKGGSAEGVEVTLNPEELDLDTAAMQAKYEETVREQQSQLEKEDLSDMVAAHAAKQRKRKKQQADSGKSGKRYKDFKF